MILHRYIDVATIGQRPGRDEGLLSDFHLIFDDRHVPVVGGVHMRRAGDFVIAVEVAGSVAIRTPQFERIQHVAFVHHTDYRDVGAIIVAPRVSRF